jgi:hypothetical protein
MNRDVLIGAGVVLAFIVLVNRAKNNQVTEPDPQGGGGGGGGGFGPFGPIAPMPPPIPPFPVTPPRPYNQGRSYTAAEITRGTVKQDVTTEMLKNQQAANTGATDRGGITGMGTGTGTSSTGAGTSSTVQYNPKDNYVKLPFSGMAMDAKFMGFVGSTPKFEFN